LIPDLKSGEDTAWNSLCERFRAGLIAKSRQLIGTSSCSQSGGPEDLVQEALIKAWSKRDSFQGQTTAQFSSWLLRILYNTFIDWNRGQNIEQNPATWFGFTADSPSPSVMAMTIEQEALLHACIAELETKQAELVMLRHFEGLKYHEIAERTQMNLNTAVGIYRRGILRLNHLMQLRCSEHPLEPGSKTQ